MSDDLIDALIAEQNLASRRLSEVHRAVLELLSNLTPDEMRIWNRIDERAKQHHDQMDQAYLDVNTIRTIDPETYFERMRALLERDSDETKSLANDIASLVRNHYKAKKR
jgi:hypothetical protein